jgi:RNA polymerase sigma-70 factor, ECF subfamily
VTTVRALRPVLPGVPPEAPAAPRDLDDAYRSYCRYVGSICLRISGRRSELEDLIQEVFAEAASSFDALREPEAMRSWLATIAVRVTRKRLYRRRLVELVGLAPPAEYERVADLAASPYDRALLASIYRILDRIDLDDRIAFVLHHVEGERLESVAALAGCSITTAKRRIARARAVLERKLSDD